MPIISGGGGGGASGPASGTYLPVGNSTGVTVDKTTFADPVAGGGAKLTTLVFPADQGALGIARTGDSFPRLLIASDPNDGIYFGNGSVDAYPGNAVLAGTQASVRLGLLTTAQGPIVIGSPAATGAQAPSLAQLSPAFTITSGALATTTLSSGSGHVMSSSADVETFTPVTFNPTAGAAATCVVAISPDGVTYSTLGTETEPAGVALDGTIHVIRARVPVNWLLKLTATNATLGTTTYY